MGESGKTVFKGRYDHAVDSKGRASLPSRFRDAIAGAADDRVVLTYALDSAHPHLDAYPVARWREFEEKLAAKPMFDPGVAMLKRLYVANAVECPIDSHGRILIPPQHREFARIGKEVVWLGMNRIVELWQPEEWRRAEAEARDRVEEVRQHLAGFDL